jgi:hypothetical protein
MKNGPRSNAGASAPDLSALPAGLRNTPRWLVWKSIPHPADPTKKPRKVPFYTDGRTRQGALDTPEDWASLAPLAEATTVLESGSYAGLGFALGPDADGNFWQGIDLDGTDTRPQLAALVETLPGYTERSPSGKGWHALGVGQKFESLGSNITGIEAYASGRYFTVTGCDGRGDLEDLAPFVTGTLSPLHKAAKPKPARPTNHAPINTSDALISDLRSALSAIRADDYETWIRMGHALAELGEQGRALWLEWSQTSDKYQPSDAKRWDGFKGDRAGYAAVFAEARDHWGWVNPSKREANPKQKGYASSGARSSTEGRAESQENLTDEQKRATLARAARLLSCNTAPVTEYPVDALGPLADATRALAIGVQIREALAGQSVLAVAAMLAQSQANIRTIESVKPLSLYCLTIGDSGDGKSSGDTVAQAAVQAYQRAEAREYLEQVRDAQANSKGRSKGEPPEELPPEPYRIARDGTVEGIRRSFAQGVPSQGVFSSEAAAMLAGYGMNTDNRAKTAATFNALWDDGELSVSRGTTGRLQLYDRRLSIHWLLQPEAAHEVMSDPLLSGIGFWPRFLVAWPEPSAPRVARPWRADQCPEIAEFWRGCTRLLDRPLGDDCSGLPVLELTPEAMRLACSYFERLERAAKGTRAPLGEIKPYAVRSTEQALRIAGVLAVFGGLDRVDAGAMRDGIALAAYALETWRGVFGDREVNTARRDALALFKWLLDHPGASASETSILQIGPRATRSRSRRDSALATLARAGLASCSGRFWSLEVSNG